MALPYVRLGDHSTLISSGATPLGGAQVYLKNGPVLFIRSQNVLMNRLSLGDAVYISEELDTRLSRTRLKQGDVLLNITGASIGRVAVFSSIHTRANVNQHVCAIRPTPDLDSVFLSRYIASPDFQARINQMQNGGTRQALTFSQVSDFLVPLPPLGEQRRISAILDQADSIRVRRRASKNKLATLPQSIFLDMFGDPITNPKGFATGTIEQTVADLKKDLRCGPFGTQLKVSEIISQGTPLLGIENVVTNRFTATTQKCLSDRKAAELAAFDVRPGDVLVTRMGTIGRACVVPEDFPGGRFSYHLFRIRVDASKCLPSFLAHTITSSGSFQRQLKRLAHGQIMEGLSTSDLRSVRFLFPPLAAQLEFSSLVEKIDTELNRSTDSLGDADRLFAALHYRAFRGEL